MRFYFTVCDRVESMELYCEKYKEVLVGGAIVCRHPKEYCKFRSACLIHFIGKDEPNRDGDSCEDAGRDVTSDKKE